MNVKKRVNLSDVTYSELIDIINSYEKQADELETLHAAYGNAQKEISDLKSHNDILIERNRRLERRSGELGKDILWTKNKLREHGIEEWKLLNKANRSK